MNDSLGDCVLLSPMSEPEPVRDWARGSGKSDGLAPSLLSALIGARAAGEIHTRCMVAGPDPDIRAHHCHHKQCFYLFTWHHHQVKKKREIEYKHREKRYNLITSIRSPVRVSGTVILQDCIFNGEEKEEKGDYVKTNVTFCIPQKHASLSFPSYKRCIFTVDK